MTRGSRGNEVRHRFLLGILVLLVMLADSAWAQTQAPPLNPAPPTSDATPDMYVTLNDASRALYKAFKESTLARGGPVILVEGDSLVLRRGEARREVRFKPAIYHDLKSVSHVTLALDAYLFALESSPVTETQRNELQRYRAIVEAARTDPAPRAFNEEQARRQTKLFRESLDMIDQVLATGRCDIASRRSFTRRVAPLVLANAADAAREELVALHALALSWKDELGPEAWAKTAVIVMGRPLPRKDNLAVQYFARLLGQPGEGPRLLYAESVFEEPRALELLATQRSDEIVSVDFFDDPLRMSRDLLGDATKPLLDQLFAARPAASNGR